MWNQIQQTLFRILPGNTMYYVGIGIAVLGILVGGWVWLRKNKAGGSA